MHKVRAAYSDLDPNATVIIFKDPIATYVYPTPLDSSPQNDTPAFSLIKKVSTKISASGKRQ